MVRRGKRVAGEAAADLYAAYGLPRDLTYPEFVRLYLNLPRVRVRRALDLVDALRVAADAAEIPPAWLDLAADTPDEARRWRRDEAHRSLLRGRG